MLCAATLRADWTVRPSESGDSVDASLFIAKVPNRLLKCFGLHNAQIIPQALWLVKYIIALAKVYQNKQLYLPLESTLVKNPGEGADQN